MDIDDIKAEHKARTDNSLRPLPSTRDAMAEGLEFWMKALPAIVAIGVLLWAFKEVM